MRNPKYFLLLCFLILPLLAFSQNKKRKSSKRNNTNSEISFPPIIYTSFGYYNNSEEEYDFNRLSFKLGTRIYHPALFHQIETSLSFGSKRQELYDTNIRHASLSYGLGRKYLNLFTGAHTIKYQVMSFESMPISSTEYLQIGSVHSMITGIDIGIIKNWGHFYLGANIDVEFINVSKESLHNHDPFIPLERQKSGGYNFDILKGTNVVSLLVGMNL